ncbi:MAG: efflux RND transporter periplasmic adaptor subunit [Verrucomicrobia bacterium]|nr:efflux RND transporter periplasmic adaptor subunit [Verrucomicrobiota bacterium]
MIVTESKQQVVLGLSLIGLSSFLMVSCQPKALTETPVASSLPEIGVETRVVKSEEVPVFDVVVGTVRPYREAQVSAKVTGRILRMLAVPGVKVKKGAVIAEIEAEELKAGLERALASREKADRDLERYRNLMATGAATRAEFDAVQAKQRMAAASVKETEVLIANASVQAPFDGTITRKLMETGDLATPGRSLFSIEDSTLLRLEINVAESFANQVELKEKFRVRVDGAAVDMDGKVVEISPAADPGSRTFLVKLDLEKNPALRAGQFGRAYLPRDKRMALSVPVQAVIQRGQMDYVFVESEGIARLRIVRSNDASIEAQGDNQNTRIEILAGVEAGEFVVISPPPELRDGQKVSSTKAQGAVGESAQEKE